MQPYGSHGMVRYFSQYLLYPTYRDIPTVQYLIDEKQRGPRGRLPICPDTCFVTGGQYPSNTLPDETEPEGAGFDYYDSLKGDVIAGTRNPPGTGSLDEDTGAIFNAHISDVKSGDVKWFTADDTTNCIVFTAANRHIYCYDSTGSLLFNIDIPTEMSSLVPLSTGEQSVQRSWRIDPKRSVVAGGKYYALVSFCDWEIRPGKDIVFSSNPEACSEGVTVAPDKLKYYPADDATGKITGYVATTRTMPDLIETHASVSCRVDDSFRILKYAHYWFIVDLTTSADRVKDPVLIHEEYLCGDVDLVIHPFEWKQCVYFKAWEAAHIYEMEAATYALIFPDGIYSLVTHTPHPLGDTATLAEQCASNLGVDISAVGLTKPVECVWVSAHPSPPPPYQSDPFLCTVGYYSYLADHYHVPNNTAGYEYGFAERGGAKGTSYKWVDQPDNTHFALLDESMAQIYELSSEEGAAGDPQRVGETAITIPTDSQVSDELYSIDPEITRFEYPLGDNIDINMLGDGAWEWCQGNFATCWTRYDASYYSWGIVTPSIGGWSDVEPYYAAGNCILYKYKPYPFEWTQWERGKELICTGVYNNCVSTDSTFSDISTFKKGDDDCIAYIRWGPNSTPFSSGSITDDPPNTAAEEIHRSATPAQQQRNNNPCLHRNARLASVPNLVVTNLATGVTTSTVIDVPTAALTAGEYVESGGNMVWQSFAHTYELHSHDEVRPKSVWGEVQNKKESDTTLKGILTSADVHVEDSIAHSADVGTTVVATGTSCVGKHQQLVIPLKYSGVNYGNAFFVSSLGELDCNVRYSNWMDGYGSDLITEEMQANRMVTGWAIVADDGEILMYQPEGALTEGNFTGPWFCKWANYIRLGNGEEWVFVGMQYADCRPEGTSTYKFKVYAIDVVNQTITSIKEETTGILGYGSVVMASPDNNYDATIFYSFYNGEDGALGVRGSYLIPFIDIEKENGPYQQMLLEFSDDTNYLFAVNDAGGVAILDSSDLTVKTTLGTEFQSISSGAEYKLVGRLDTVALPAVSTSIGMESYAD